MYDDAMSGVQAHLMQKSHKSRLTYTSELIPERNPAGEMSVLKPRVTPDFITFMLIRIVVLQSVETDTEARSPRVFFRRFVDVGSRHNWSGFSTRFDPSESS